MPPNHPARPRHARRIGAPVERYMPSVNRAQLVFIIAMGIAIGAISSLRQAGAQSWAPAVSTPIYTLPITPTTHPDAPTITRPIAPTAVTPRPRGPLARLIKNSDTSEGLPPYALADQSGAIQRYVEPTPSIDLEAHIGSIVTVRHDTGKTLLASQIELPPLSLERAGPAESQSVSTMRSASRSPSYQVRPAEFVDNNDATVELLDDQGSNASPHDKPAAVSPTVEPPTDTIEPIAAGRTIGQMSDLQTGGPIWSEEATAGGGPVFVDSFPPEMAGGGVGYPVNDYGVPNMQPNQPYYEDGMSFEDFGGSRGLIDRTFNSPNCRFFGDVELMLMRLHLTESVAGKLSEQYKFSPRVIIGFEGGDISDGRVRYWTYDHQTPILEAGGGSVRFEFEVLDIEATQRFQIRRSDIIVGAGLRLAKINIGDDDSDEVGTDLYGLTVAADARTYLCKLEEGAFSWVYGARLSILGGDWGGDPNSDLVAVPAQDDNVVVNELNAGVEYAFCVHNIDLQARLSFELQNWHSDVFARSSQADTIGFVGPGIHLGAQF